MPSETALSQRMQRLTLTRLDVEVAAANAYFDLATAQQLAAIAPANIDRFQTHRGH